MTYPPPSQPPRPAPTGQRRRGMGKVLLVALLIGAVVGVLSGTGAFLGSRNLTGPSGTVRCDGKLCFSNFELDDVTGFLTGQGFTCDTSRDCSLWTGSARYEARLVGGDSEWLRRYEASVSYPPGVAMPGRGEEYLAWFAALPFGADAADASAAREWLAANRHDSGDHSARTDLGGYELWLVHWEQGDMRVSLTVEAGEPWL